VFVLFEVRRFSSLRLWAVNGLPEMNTFQVTLRSGPGTTIFFRNQRYFCVLRWKPGSSAVCLSLLFWFYILISSFFAFGLFVFVTFLLVLSGYHLLRHTSGGAAQG
jgi:hypothetical protein